VWNGARCIGAYLDKFFNKDECKIETLAGIKHVKKLGENEFELFMGKMQKLGKFVKDNKEKTELKFDFIWPRNVCCELFRTTCCNNNRQY